MYRCTVIILTYNSEDDIVATLDALFDQRAEFDFEVIVADNNSQDDTVQIVKDYPQEISVLAFEHNWGASVGYNKALEHSTGEYVAYLNPDTTVHRDWLSSLYNGLLESEAAAAMSSVFEPGDQGYTPDDREGQKEIVKVKDVARTGYVYNGEHPNPHRPVRTLHLAGNSMLFDREVLDELGHVFEEEFFLFADDVDIALRLNVLGFRTVQIPDAIVYHHQYDRKSPSSLRWLARKHIWATSGRFLSFYKNMTIAEFLLALPLLFLGGIFNARAMGVSKSKRIIFAFGGVFLTVYSLGVLVLRRKTVRAHRAEIQRDRVRSQFWLIDKMFTMDPPRKHWDIDEP